ncbi:hypothetical protein [Paenibacillus sp. CF384]|uniref:hypothetical protein n=1 Tax=Paenibacillus sp. CF384 TaxID=1884382 RepID=UPI0008974F4C|nr:hypothetical protein [Paenibacillus sp. CF384]SDW22718.1 hypothetical protein SAMN05518855_1001723 [Paenibacillus sp. CF384]
MINRLVETAIELTGTIAKRTRSSLPAATAPCFIEVTGTIFPNTQCARVKLEVIIDIFVSDIVFESLNCSH